MTSLHDEIRALTQTFTADLATVVRRTAVEALHAALGGVSPAPAAPTVPAPAAPPRARPQAAPKPAAAKAPARPAAKAPARPAAKAPAPPTAKKRAAGKKRAPAEIQALVDKLASYVAGHPGATMEAIRDALGTASVDLAVPAKKLITAGKIRAEGKKQLTRYFPVGSSAR